jgi:hypothetical protein
MANLDDALAAEFNSLDSALDTEFDGLDSALDKEFVRPSFGFAPGKELDLEGFGQRDEPGPRSLGIMAEDLGSAITEAPKAVVAGLEKAAGIVGTGFTYMGDVMEDPARRFMAKAAPVPAMLQFINDKLGTAKILKEQGTHITDVWNDMASKGWEAPDPELMEQKWNRPLQYGSRIIFENAPTYAGAIGAGYATGNPALGLTILGAFEKLNSYAAQRGKDGSFIKSDMISSLSGAWEAATEIIPFNYVLKGVGTRPAKALISAGLEGLQELIAGMGQNILEYFGYNVKDWDTIPGAIKEGFKHIMDNWLENVVAGAGMGGPAGFISGSSSGQQTEQTAPQKIPPGSNIYQTKSGRTVIETPADIGTEQGTELRGGRVYERATGEELFQVEEGTVSGIQDAPKGIPVYHGGPVPKEGLPKLSKAAATDIKGVYFSTTQEGAQSFIDSADRGGSVQQFDIRIKNPATDKLALQIEEELEEDGFVVPQLYEAVADELIQRGYDSVIRDSEIIVLKEELVSKSSKVVTNLDEATAQAPPAIGPSLKVTTIDAIDGTTPGITVSIEAHKENEVQKLIDEGMDRKDAESLTLTPEEYKAEVESVKTEEKRQKTTRKKQIRHAGPKGQVVNRLNTVDRKTPSRKARLRANKVLALGMKIKDMWSSYVLRQDRIFNLGRMLDGYDSNGPITTHIVRPIRSAIVRGRDGTERAMSGIREKLDAAGVDFSKLIKRKPTDFDGGLRLSGMQLGGVYLVAQNENGRRRLDNDLDSETVDEIVKHVENDSDLTALTQAIQAYVAERSKMFFAAAEAMEIEVTPEEAYITFLMLDPTEIDSMPITDRFKKVFSRGVKARGEEKTIKRTKTDAAVEYDLMRILPNMIQGMENFIEVGPAAQTVDNILRDQGVKDGINRVTRGHGSEIFKKWLHQSASGSADISRTWIGPKLQYLRRNAMLFVLGGKILSVVPKQGISAWNAIAIRPAVMPGIFKRLASYGDMGVLGKLKSDFALVSEKSKMVKNRDWERDTKRSFNKVGMRKFFGHKKLSPLSMRWTAIVDRATVTAVWLSSYERAVADNMSKKVAIQYADDMVSQTQPMGNIEDLPELFRDGQIEQLITTFLNQPNQNFQNLRHNIWGEMRAGKISKTKAMQRFLIGQVLPSQILGLITRGRLPDDPGEMLTDLVFYLTTPWFFFGRWGYNTATGFWDAEDSAVSTLPFSGFEEVGRGVRAAKKGDIRGVIEHGVGAAGAFTGKIPKQAITTTLGVVDLLEGETDDLRRLYYSKYMVEKVIDKNE